MIDDIEEAEYTLHGKRGAVWTFTGQRIGYVSTGHRNRSRWQELAMYRVSDEDVWVLHLAAMSKVIHAPTCPRARADMKRLQEVHPGADPLDGSWWLCEEPADRLSSGNFVITDLVIENTINSLWRSGDATELASRLQRVDQYSGAVRTPEPAIDLLNQAARNDPDFQP